MGVGLLVGKVTGIAAATGGSVWSMGLITRVRVVVGG